MAGPGSSAPSSAPSPRRSYATRAVRYSWRGSAPSSNHADRASFAQLPRCLRARALLLGWSMSFEGSAQTASFHDEGHGFDVFGLHPHAVARAVAAGAPLYEHYFRVDSRGVEQIPET